MRAIFEVILSMPSGVKGLHVPFLYGKGTVTEDVLQKFGLKELYGGFYGRVFHVAGRNRGREISIYVYPLSRRIQLRIHKAVAKSYGGSPELEVVTAIQSGKLTKRFLKKF